MVYRCCCWLQDEADVVFRSENGKWRAAVVEVARMHKMGRPVLVGTTSVEQSETLSARLKEAGVPHQVRSQGRLPSAPP